MLLVHQKREANVVVHNIVRWAVHVIGEGRLIPDFCLEPLSCIRPLPPFFFVISLLVFIFNISIIQKNNRKEK